MRTLALSKLREARALYMQAKSGAPQPEQIAGRIRSIDGLIETLDADAGSPKK
jgi:hypothetical protein